jgi:cyclopropane-fatty-acyl-phospholipid synthase
VEALGFDQTFRRTWEYYLASCEAGFTTGHLDVRQFILEAQP